MSDDEITNSAVVKLIALRRYVMFDDGVAEEDSQGPWVMFEDIEIIVNALFKALTFFKAALYYTGEGDEN
jgi:hypothetical protein